MTAALDFLRLGFLSCAVFVSLITIVVLRGKCCNKRRRLAAASAVKDSEVNTAAAAQSPSACVESDAGCSFADVHAITGQPQLPSPVECHRLPILFEPSFSSQMTSESSSKRRQPNNSANHRIGSPLNSIDDGMKQTILSQKTSKQQKISSVSVLARIEEHEPMTGDVRQKSDSNRDEIDGGGGGDPGVSRAACTEDSRQGRDRRQLTASTRSSVVTNRDSLLSSNTYNTINTVNTANSYETMFSTDSGFKSRNSQGSQHYDWMIIRSSDSESCSNEQTSFQRRRVREAEGEEEGQRNDEGVYDPQYDSLYPHYCGTLLPSDGTYEALKKPVYPATISTAHPVTQSQQIELKNMIKADANPKRNTVSLG